MPDRFLKLFDSYTHIDSLAQGLGCDSSLFELSKSHLKLHEIPKKRRNLGYRLIWEVTDKPRKVLIGTFTVEYEKYVRSKDIGYPHSCVQGFLSGKSTYTNASQHTKNKLLLNLDIERFFDSITTEHVKCHFIKMNLKERIAQTLAQLLTVDGYLPQGFSSSPLLSNLIFLEIDKKLSELALKHGSTYSRYADDLSFSSCRQNPSVDEIDCVLKNGGFKLNENKTRIRKFGQPLYVTGLSISDSRPRVPRKWKRRLRQEIYYISKWGLEKHCIKNGIGVDAKSTQSVINKISGRLGYIKPIEPEVFKSLNSSWVDYLNIEKREVSYQSRSQGSKTYDFFFDESIKDDLMFLCLSKTERLSDLKESLENFYNEISQDDDMPRRAGAFDEKNVLHWNKLSNTARQRLASVVKFLDFAAHISCKKYNEGKKKEYSETYLYLFRKLLKNRFTSSDGCAVNINVEYNNRISLNGLQSASDVLYDKLLESDSKRPSKRPSVQILKKTDSICLCIPDCILGIAREYLLQDTTKLNPEELGHISSNYRKVKYKIKSIQFIQADHGAHIFTVKKFVTPREFQILTTKGQVQSKLMKIFIELWRRFMAWAES